jgi:23S rRNA (guanosine2251-2'-O)-methyltransferase
MAGNSQRKGATRKAGSKKGATVGSGGQRRAGLEGRKPTPKAVDRDKHPAARRARAATRTDAAPRRGPAGRGPRTRKDGGELLYGRNTVVEAMRAGVPGSTLYVQQYVDSDDRVREALQLAADRRLPLLEAPRAELDKMTGGGVHQGLALAVPAYEYLDPADLLASALDSDADLLVVALDGVTDPRNLGAVVRSAAAFGAQGLFFPERRAAGMTATAWRTSAGAAARLPIAQVTNLTRALKACQEAGFLVAGLDADGSTSVYDLEAAVGPMVVVVGSEGRGLSRLVGSTCDIRVSIPMLSTVESLNASVAAAVSLAEIARRRTLA